MYQASPVQFHVDTRSFAAGGSEGGGAGEAVGQVPEAPHFKKSVYEMTRPWNAPCCLTCLVVLSMQEHGRSLGSKAAKFSERRYDAPEPQPYCLSASTVIYPEL